MSFNASQLSLAHSSSSMLDKGKGPAVQDGSELLPTLSSLLLATAQAMKPPSGTLNSTSSYIPTIAPEQLLADPSSSAYLSSLLAMPLSTLESLPASLSALCTSLDNDLSSLAFTRYSSFLLAHSATSAISTSFTTLSSSLQDLLDSTASLETAALNFDESIKQVRHKRDRMTKVRERMEEVEELLESPAVVDACVRAGFWTEAIDVAVRLSDLHARLSLPSSRSQEDAKGALVLLGSVREEVSIALASLRARVLESLLQRGLKLPGAVRGLAILRRMNEGGLGLEAGGEIEEPALRIVFLAARWRCLRGELESVEGQMAASGIKLGIEEPERDLGSITIEENEESTRWVKRWIEIWREVVGETVGMYSEVFLGSHSEPTKPTALPALAPLTLFLSTSLAALTATITSSLPALNSSSSLSSLLTQLAYCSHSFARYGFEFREVEQIRELIEERMGNIITGEWELAGRLWEKEWREGWQSGARRKGRTGAQSLGDWLVVPEGVNTVLSTALPSLEIQGNWAPQPQAALALLPPLARFLNAHATAMNALRLLPAISLYPSLRLAQGRELERGARVLEAFVDAWTSAVDNIIIAQDPSPEDLLAREMRKQERALIMFTVVAFGHWVIPWIENALRLGIYGDIAEDQVETMVTKAISVCDALVAKLDGPKLSSGSLSNGGEEPSVTNGHVEGVGESWPIDANRLSQDAEGDTHTLSSTVHAEGVEEVAI